MISAPGKKVVFSDEVLKIRTRLMPRMHEEGPLHYVEVANKWAVWSIFSHAECSSIAKDPRLSAKRAKQMLSPLPLSRQAEFSELARMLSLWLIFMDPPEHTRLRKLLNKGFSAVAVEGLRPQVEAIVDKMLTPLQHGSEVELMHEFANPMPVRIISELLGVPEALHGTFVERVAGDRRVSRQSQSHGRRGTRRTRRAGRINGILPEDGGGKETK